MSIVLLISLNFLSNPLPTQDTLFSGNCVDLGHVLAMNEHKKESKESNDSNPGDEAPLPGNGRRDNV